MNKPIIEPLYSAPNTKYKKRMEKEAKKILENLTVLEMWFLNELFNEDVRASYKTLYDHYWRQFDAEIKRIDRVVKPKYFKVNSYYFWENYGPVEKPYQSK